MPCDMLKVICQVRDLSNSRFVKFEICQIEDLSNLRFVKLFDSDAVGWSPRENGSVISYRYIYAIYTAGVFRRTPARMSHIGANGAHVCVRACMCRVCVCFCLCARPCVLSLCGIVWFSSQARAVSHGEGLCSGYFTSQPASPTAARRTISIW